MKTDHFWIFLLVVMFLITSVADMTVGHGSYFWIFTIVIWLLLRSIGSGGVSWFYLFMGLFFVFGCWLKIVFHHIFDYPFVEPAGGFQGTIVEWGEYYKIAISLAVSFITARYLYLLIFRNFGGNYGCRDEFKSVSWTEWAFLVGVATIFYAANNIFAFFVTGVNPKIVLPLSLNAPLGFMAVSGFAVVVSLYLSRDFCSKGYLASSSVAAILFIATLASVSMASRAALIMQALPMLLAAMYLQIKNGAFKFSFKPILMFGFFLATVLILVSIYRINVFMSGSAFDEDLLAGYSIESLGLVIDRWIGAEAIMAAVSDGGGSFALMMDLLREDPAIGNDAIYQILSGSKYVSIDNFTFLTLPGYIGILALSGSSLLVFLGGVTVLFAGLCFERFVRWAMFRQGICVAVVCAALANALTQLSFPRLLLPFIFQLVALSLILHFVIRNVFLRTRFRLTNRLQLRDDS